MEIFPWLQLSSTEWAISTARPSLAASKIRTDTELFLGYRQVAGCGAKPFSIASVTAKMAGNRQSNS
jgi:hypothetical protein